ncbi:MAG: hypothetical protein ACJ0Q6_03110 [Candidatus Azotimanducaceae bacterium]
MLVHLRQTELLLPPDQFPLAPASGLLVVHNGMESRHYCSLDALFGRENEA